MYAVTFLKARRIVTWGKKQVVKQLLAVPGEDRTREASAFSSFNVSYSLKHHEYVFCIFLRTG